MWSLTKSLRSLPGSASLRQRLDFFLSCRVSSADSPSSFLFLSWARRCGLSWRERPKKQAWLSAPSLGAPQPLFACVCACSVTQLCQTLCNPRDCSSPGSSVHGISQAKIAEWVAISYSRGSSRPRDRLGIQPRATPTDRVSQVLPSWLLPQFSMHRKELEDLTFFIVPE